MRKILFTGAVGALVAVVATTTPALAQSAGTIAPTTVPEALVVASAPASTGAYTPLKAARVLDTRSRNGVTTMTPIGAGGTVTVQVTGRSGVPTSGVSAVVLNVTVTSPTEAGYLTVYPTEQARPATSSINFVHGSTRANLVTVPLGAGGKVSIFNGVGTTHAIADVQGYYLSGATIPTAGTWGSYQPVAPVRLYDTRASTTGKPWPPGAVRWGIVNFGEANPRVRALALNVTAVSPSGSGYLTAFQGDPNHIPATSSLNYTAGQATPNMVIVPTSLCLTDCSDPNTPIFGLYNSRTASTQVIVDLVGYYDDNSTGQGLRFSPVTPQRIVDSRSSLGAAPLTKDTERTVTLPENLAGIDTYGIVGNVTAVRPTANTYVSLWQTGDARPNVSNLNATAQAIVANMAMFSLDQNYRFNAYNRAGTTHLLVDVTGTFEQWPPMPAKVRTPTGPTKTSAGGRSRNTPAQAEGPRSFELASARLAPGPRHR